MHLMGHANTDCCEARALRTIGSGPPCDGFPCLGGEALGEFETGSALGFSPTAGRQNCDCALLGKNADGIGTASLGQSLPELGGFFISCIGKNRRSRNSSGNQTIHLFKRDFNFFLKVMSAGILAFL